MAMAVHSLNIEAFRLYPIQHMVFSIGGQCGVDVELRSKTGILIVNYWFCIKGEEERIKIFLDNVNAAINRANSI